MRRTKIVCTIGPASHSDETLERLIAAGMNVARLNFSHGTYAWHADIMARIRTLAERLQAPVAILQDLGGPKVRIGNLASGPVELKAGEAFVLTARDVSGDAQCVSLNYAGLVTDVKSGDVLLLSDGDLELRVDHTTEHDIVCRVTIGGTLYPRKGITAPSRSLRVPFLTEKDRRDAEFGLAHGVDYIALSFVRTADDVREARQFLAGLDAVELPPLIGKIEKHEALGQIDEILDEVDGIMVARGDLGVEIPIEQVPRIQKMLIRKANERAKPVITATQMLRSMVESPKPTRAEVTDVANAIHDGTDAVMLSEETAQGHYPVEAVAMMNKLAVDAESLFGGLDFRPHAADVPAGEAVAAAAARLAQQVGARAIITCTQSGSTTRLVSKMRPTAALAAATPDEGTYRRLALVWAAKPLLMAAAESAEEMERRAVNSAAAAGFVEAGDTVIITAGLPLHVPGTTNTVKVITVPR